MHLDPRDRDVIGRGAHRHPCDAEDLDLDDARAARPVRCEVDGASGLLGAAAVQPAASLDGLGAVVGRDDVHAAAVRRERRRTACGLGISADDAVHYRAACAASAFGQVHVVRADLGRALAAVGVRAAADQENGTHNVRTHEAMVPILGRNAMLSKCHAGE